MIIQTRWEEIPCMVKDEQVNMEYNALDRVCREVYDSLGYGIAIEIGSFHGRSTALLAQYFTVFAIDVWGLGYEQGNTGKMENYSDFGGDAFKEFFKNMTDRDLIEWQHNEKSMDRIHAICSTSKFLDWIPKLDIHFAFIDAEHTYPAAYNDLVRCAKHLKSGGIMSMHDCMRPHWGYGDMSRGEVDPWYGNKQSLDKFLESYPFEIKEHIEGIIFIGEKND